MFLSLYPSRFITWVLFVLDQLIYFANLQFNYPHILLFLKLSLLFHSSSLHLTIYLSCLFLFYIIISQNRNTPLLLAIAIGLTNVAIVLIEKHAYIDAKDRVSATFCTESFSWKFYPSMSQWILPVCLSTCMSVFLSVYLPLPLSSFLSHWLFSHIFIGRLSGHLHVFGKWR